MNDITQQMYKEYILDLYKNPLNKNELKDFDFKLEGNNPLCGDEIEIRIKLNNEGKVEQVGHTGDGCAISQASVSLLTDKIKGMGLEEIKKLNEEDIFDLLGIQISHTRLKCALLSLKTIQKIER